MDLNLKNKSSHYIIPAILTNINFYNSLSAGESKEIAHENTSTSVVSRLSNVVSQIK